MNAEGASSKATVWLADSSRAPRDGAAGGQGGLLGEKGKDAEMWKDSNDFAMARLDISKFLEVSALSRLHQYQLSLLKADVSKIDFREMTVMSTARHFCLQPLQLNV